MGLSFIQGQYATETEDQQDVKFWLVESAYDKNKGLFQIFSPEFYLYSALAVGLKRVILW